jgi:hypothetical protein
MASRATLMESAPMANAINAFSGNPSFPEAIKNILSANSCR